ncbi:MAG: hypothetical protein ABI474_11575 [Actinomycetota bacterium]
MEAAKGPGRTLARALAAWPMRKRVAVAVLMPLLLVLSVSAAGGWASATSYGWTALVILVALASAMTLASYLPSPGTGLKLDLGCTPCAGVAALSVVASVVLLSSSPGDVPTAFLALGVAAFGLRQRLANPSTCPA